MDVNPLRPTTDHPPSSPEEYCRRIEAYLCRKNDGHLIRIVGPAFEQVCGWAQRGVPLKVAFGGIDRYFERYYAKGPRRRPVRVEFCEADVLDAFDQWRRALGITAADAAAPPGQHKDATGRVLPDAPEPERRHGSLTAHVDRVIARLTALRAGADRALDDVLDRVVRELDGVRAKARGLRGDAREALLARLQELDSSLIGEARERLEAPALAECRAEADAELLPFRHRLAREEYDRAYAACVDRLVRQRYRLPVIAFE